MKELISYKIQTLEVGNEVVRSGGRLIFIEEIQQKYFLSLTHPIMMRQRTKWSFLAK